MALQTRRTLHTAILYRRTRHIVLIVLLKDKNEQITQTGWLFISSRRDDNSSDSCNFRTNLSFLNIILKSVMSASFIALILCFYFLQTYWFYWNLHLHVHDKKQLFEKEKCTEPRYLKAWFPCGEEIIAGCDKSIDF